MLSVREHFVAFSGKPFYCIPHSIYLRKFQRKHPWLNAFASEIKKNIQPRMFSQKFTRIFQSSHFAEHFRVVVLLICKVSCLNDSYLIFFSTRQCFLILVFFFPVRITLELPVITVGKPLRWRLQVIFFFVFSEKIFAWWECIKVTIFHLISQQISRKVPTKLT